MTCPQCGNENPPKLKFCVSCGTNLENPQEINYEQVDMGNYHSEEEPSSGGFSLSSGTFTICDNTRSTDTSSDFYTAEELNSDEEEFDFSSFDEPFIPKLDAERLSLPSMERPAQQPVPQQAHQPQGMYGYPQQPQQMGGAPQQMGGMPQQMGGMPQQMGGMPQQMGGMPQQMGGMPQMNAMPPQPQIIGYDQNGMPIYGQVQPMMYPQPQIIGYDQNGMPIYGQAQPMMYGQPQIIGYDQNGMPIYGQAQPMMYPQPQVISYDQNGMPIYGQAPVMMYPQQPMQPMQGDMPGMPNMGGMYGMPTMGGMPQMQPYGQQQPVQNKPKNDRVEVSDDFWKFFDGGKSTDHKDSDDFFGSKDMSDVSADNLDVSRLKRFEHKKNDYMSDTPIVDGSRLAANTEAKYNKLYMKQTETVNAEDLQAKEEEHTQDIMGVTKDVDAEKIQEYKHYKSRISMEHTEEANADELEAYTPEHTEAIMAQAEHAVEALPKKKTTYVDEIDAIELPEYMQAKKTVRDDTPQIPGLPEI
ncbi:MAG: hypothetical protein IJA18_08260 [Ruminococcus sp.]|nr:hypothetical protein [Ruminococcus sp.]